MCNSLQEICQTVSDTTTTTTTKKKKKKKTHKILDIKTFEKPKKY